MLKKCIDTHVHIWNLNDFDYNWPTNDMKIYKNYSIDDYIKDTVTLKNEYNVEIKGVVLVQVLNNQNETEKLIEISKSVDFIRGIVGWTDLTDVNVETNIKYLKNIANGKLVGFRHILDCKVSPETWLLKEEVQRALDILHKNNLCFDLLLRPNSLKCIPELCKRLDPNMKLVIDHIAKPRMSLENEDVEWFVDIENASKYPNVYCKLSGLINEVTSQTNLKLSEKYSIVNKYIKHVINCFGYKRCMYGADWPVFQDIDQCSLRNVFGYVDNCLSENNVSESTWNEVFYENALTFYGLLDNLK